MPPIYTYVIVRADLTLADTVVQVGHVSLQAGASFDNSMETYLILLKVPNQKELEKAHRDLTMQNICHSVFFEPCNLKGIELGITAIATEGIAKADPRRSFFDRFRLWKPTRKHRRPTRMAKKKNPKPSSPKVDKYADMKGPKPAGKKKPKGK